jgi:hypothetical protein
MLCVLPTQTPPKMRKVLVQVHAQGREICVAGAYLVILPIAGRLKLTCSEFSVRCKSV